MAEPFLSELKLVSFNFPPKGWALCNGQLLPINQNQALFSLLGTTYGGNGQTNFALPDMRGRAAVHQGDGFTLGQRAGEEFHTVSISETPTHNHLVNASTLGGNQPQISVLGSANNLYGAVTDMTTLNPATITNVGGSQPHENRAPSLVLNWIIALQGIFPSQN